MEFGGLQTIGMSKISSPHPTRINLLPWQQHSMETAWSGGRGERWPCFLPLAHYLHTHPHGHNHWRGPAQHLKQAWEGSETLVIFRPRGKPVVAGVGLCPWNSRFLESQRDMWVWVSQGRCPLGCPAGGKSLRTTLPLLTKLEYVPFRSQK